MINYTSIRTSTILCALLFLFSASLNVSAETRVALVIGNSSYRNVPSLANPANDAKLMADTLRSLGFKLVGGGAQLDLDKAGFDRAVQSFGQQLQGAEVALFYYAGHGVQVRGGNYLVPVNANPTREADVDFQMLDTNLVLRQMESSGTRLNLVILDACRNNPFGGRGLRSTTSGLAQMQAPEGTLISFATQPGNVAVDGNDGHSPFTKALAETLRKPGLGLFDAFNEVGLTVKRTTGGAQQPWVSSSPITGNFYFAGRTTPELPAAVPDWHSLFSGQAIFVSNVTTDIQSFVWFLPSGEYRLISHTARGRFDGFWRPFGEGYCVRLTQPEHCFTFRREIGGWKATSSTTSIVMFFHDSIPAGVSVPTGTR